MGWTDGVDGNQQKCSSHQQPPVATHSPTRPICQQEQEGMRLDRPRVVVCSPPPTDFRAFVRSFQFIILLLPAWPVLSLRVAPFLAPSLVGGGRGHHFGICPVCLPLTRQSVNQLINQSVSSRSLSPCPQWKSTLPSVLRVNSQLCRRGQDIRKIDQFLSY